MLKVSFEVSSFSRVWSWSFAKTPSTFTLTFPGSRWRFLSFLPMSLPGTLQLYKRDPRNCGFQERRSQGLGFFFSRGSLVLLQICLLPHTQKSALHTKRCGMRSSSFWGPCNVCFLPCGAVLPAWLTYVSQEIHPRIVTPQDGWLCPCVIIPVAGDIYNFLHITHPKQVSLISALKQLPLSCGRDWIKWKHQSFMLSHASPTLCKVEVFCSSEYKGYEKILWPIQFRDEWPCHHGSCIIRASVTDSMRWNSVSGIAPESSLPNP